MATQTEIKETIENFVKDQLLYHSAELEDVKNTIKNYYNHLELSNVDNSFIERKYIKYCSEFCLDEIRAFVDYYLSKNQSFLLELLDLIPPIQTLRQVPELFSKSLKFLQLKRYSELIGKEGEQEFIHKLKTNCFEQIRNCSPSVEKELAFLDFFCAFLATRESRGIHSKVLDFCDQSTPFTQLLNTFFEFVSSGEASELREIVGNWLHEERHNFIFEKSFRDIFRIYIKRAEVSLKYVDGRNIVEISGKSVVTSEILAELEEHLKIYEEVRFVGADLIYFDVNFRGDVWHGKNLVIYADSVEICGQITWDLSGKSAVHEYKTKAKTTTFDGKRGADGKSGESGGNVLLMTKNITHAENLTIISNGGNGSQGQDGGNGKSGPDGPAITKQLFKEKFPSVIKFIGNEKEAVMKTRENFISWRVDVKQNSNSDGNKVTKQLCNEKFPSAIRFIGKEKEAVMKTRENFSSWIVDVEKKNSDDLYFVAKNSDGNKVTFSYSASKAPWNLAQAFLLYQGAPGKPGGSFGPKGIGGRGGFNGIVRIPNGKKKINILASPGSNGKDGKDGDYGIYGKNGWDIAYTDYMWWPNTTYYGTDHDSKLKLVREETITPLRIWSDIENTYFEIIPVKNEPPAVVKSRFSTKIHSQENSSTNTPNRQLDKDAEAVRKKALNENAIVSEYANLFASLEKNQLIDMKKAVDQAKEKALNALLDDKEEEKKITTRAKIRKHATLPITRSRKKTNRKSEQEIDLKDNYSKKSLLNEVINRPLTVESCSKLNEIELQLADFDKLRSVSAKVVGNFKKAQIEALLLEKYYYAILGEISTKLNPDDYIVSVPEMSAESEAKFLVPSKTKGEVLEALEQPYNEELFNKSSAESSIEMFVLKSDNRSEVVAQVREEYHDFQRTKKRMCKIYSDALMQILSKLGIHVKLCSDLTTVIHNRNDAYLNRLFSKYQTELGRSFDWNKCFANERLLTVYKNDMGEKNDPYRELLADVLDVNIRLYVRNGTQFSLRNNHNITSRKVIHVLYEKERFHELELNKNYHELYTSRLKLSQIYAKLLQVANNFTQQSHFDDFLENFHKHLNDLDSFQLDDGDVTNEERYIKEILLHFPADEARLSKLKANFIGRSEILRQISKRFSCEGCHISRQVFHLLVNIIFDFVLANDRQGLGVVTWITAGFAQENWLDELILLQIENHLKQRLSDKTEFRLHLNKVRDCNLLLLFSVKLSQCTQNLNGDDIKVILYLLSVLLPQKILKQIEGLDLVQWIYALKAENYKRRLKSVSWWNADCLQTVAYHILLMENNSGQKSIESFFKWFTNNFKKNKKITERELSFIVENLSLIADGEFVTRSSDAKTDRSVATLVHLIKTKDNITTRKIFHRLPSLQRSIDNLPAIRNLGKEIAKFSEDEIKCYLKENFHSTDKLADEVILAMICRAIEIKRQIKLRHTQKLTILTLFRNRDKTLTQVSTGEGKSLIVVGLAIMRVLLRQEKVDVVTNSSVLAKRDAKANVDVYGVFNVNVAHNCSEDLDKRKSAYSNNDVVYGDLSSFQRDYLLDRFYGGKNILGDRKFESVVVDEVDSMLLDRGNNMLYLSEDLVGLDKLESLYLFIWMRINTPIKSFDDLKFVLNHDYIKACVLYDLYGVVQKEELKLIDSSFNSSQIDKIWDILIQQEIIRSDGRLILEDHKKLTDLTLSDDLLQYKTRLFFFLKQHINRQKIIQVPNYLKPFIDLHLDNWIKSAISAFCMQERVDYIVDVDRSNSTSDRNPQIIILDRDTGTDQVNSQWDEALHQFLQLKHGCRLTMQSLKSVFISNVSFFKLYKNLYGLTGTLGSKSERDLLQEIHKVDFVTIPTSKPKQFRAERPILCADSDEWLKNVRERASDIVKNQKRSVLIIAESVSDVDSFYKVLTSVKSLTNVYSYKRDYEDFSKVLKDGKLLHPGHIIIATNLAGRGTDIQISESLNESGGLHIILTYLPNNTRIEQQAFGRAARSGCKGSGQLIIKSSEDQSLFKLFELKKERDLDEMKRISDIEEYYKTQIAAEEDSLQQFQEEFKELSGKLDTKKVDQEVKEILLKSCLNRWAYWLDGVSTKIKNKEDIKSQLQEFISQLKELSPDEDCWKIWIDDSPILMLKLAKYFARKKNYIKALELFDIIIAEEPSFEAAYYYKAYTVFGKNPEMKKQLKNLLSKARELLDGRIRFCMQASGVIENIKENNPKSLIQIKAFEEQKKIEINTHEIFKRSISIILGRNLFAEDFVSHSLSILGANKSYREFIEKEILKQWKIRSNYGKDVLEKICADFQIPVDCLKSFIEKLKGENIEVDGFRKDLKKQISLPCRSDFWNFLVKSGVLSDEFQYVIVDKDSLDKSQTGYSLPDQMIQNFGVLKENEMLLNPEQLDVISENSSNYLIFPKTYFIHHVGLLDYKILKKGGTLTCNKIATIDCEKLKKVNFANFDSISLQDFDRDISESDAKEILQQLVKSNVVRKVVDSNCYKLAINFTEVSAIQLASHPVYETYINDLIAEKFKYRIALQKLETQITQKQTPRIELMSKPLNNLFFSLVEQRVIRPAKVNRKAKINEKLIKQILKKFDNKNEPNTLRNILKILEDSKGTLKTIDTPQCDLRPLLQYFEQRNVEDLESFVLNGSDLVLYMKEAQWTPGMLLSTTLVCLIGIAQISSGIYLIYYDCILSKIPFVGQFFETSFFINAGIHDIMYSISALRSGYFSWKDYLSAKITNTALTLGTLSLASCFQNVKAAASAVTKVAPKNVVSEIAKKVGVKTFQGFVYGTAQLGVDYLVQNSLKAATDGIATKILSGIDNDIEENKEFSECLKKIYRVYGKDEGRTVINDLFDDFLEQPSNFEAQEQIFAKILEFIKTQACGALIKRGHDNLAKVMAVLCVLAIPICSIVEIRKLTERMMADLCKRITLKLHNRRGTFDDSVECENFKKETVERWIMIHQQKTSQVLNQQIVHPTVQFCTNIVITGISTAIQNQFEKYQEKRNSHKFDKLKKKYYEDIQNAEDNTNKNRDKSQIVSNLNKGYHKKLLELNDKVKTKEMQEKILSEVKRNNHSPLYESATSLIPGYILTRKFLSDHPDDVLSQINYDQRKRLQTVAVAKHDDILYISCNYEISDTEGNGSNFGWGKNAEVLGSNLERYCKLSGIKGIEFLEPAIAPLTYPENHAPHAEMQLLAYAKQKGLKFDIFDVSKPPCVKCESVLSDSGVKYAEGGCGNPRPKNWENPKDIHVKSVHRHVFGKTEPDGTWVLPTKEYKTESIKATSRFRDSPVALVSNQLISLNNCGVVKTFKNTCKSAITLVYDGGKSKVSRKRSESLMNLNANQGFRKNVRRRTRSASFSSS